MHCWSRYLLWLTIAVLGTGNLLLACGQKGPLYLPEPEPEEKQVEKVLPE
jgi:predicted small lipoprotein YifL